MKYTAGIIGLGRIGYTLGKDKKREQPASHSHALKKNRHISLVAGCDLDKNAVSHWKKEFSHMRVYTDVAEFVKYEKPDIVTVAVNESAHYDVASQIIKNTPKAVILEKPVALSVDEARMLQADAEKYAVPVLVNHERRFSLDYQSASALVKSGRIGKIESLYATLSSGMRIYSAEEENTGNYSLWHDGTHLIDCIHFLLGGTLSSLSVLHREYDQGNALRLLSVGASCAAAYVHIEMSGQRKYFGFDIDIRGTLGRILIGNGYFKLFERKESPFYTGFYSLMQNRSIRRPGRTLYFSNMVQSVVDYLDGSAPLQSTIADGINTLEVLDLIKRQL